MSFTVAIDGPAASGKGTIARAIAAEFGFIHLDTGLLYRAVGMLVAEGRDPVEAAKDLTRAHLTRNDLRSEAAGQAASQVAAIPEVRAELLNFQRRIALSEPGAVLDGRDYCIPEDVTSNVVNVCAHRLVVRARPGERADEEAIRVLEDAVQRVPSPV